MFGGVRIFYSEAALQDSDVRNFPTSPHRSKRIHKKLLKRFGGEFVQKPCIYRVGHTIFAHPSFRAQIEKASCPSPTGLSQRFA